MLPSTPNAYFFQNRCSRLRKHMIFHNCVHTGGSRGCGCHSCPVPCLCVAMGHAGAATSKHSFPSTRNAHRFCVVGTSSVSSPAQTVLPSTPNAYFLQNRRSHLRKTIIFHDCVHAGGPVAVAAIAVRCRAPIWPCWGRHFKT